MSCGTSVREVGGPVALAAERPALYPSTRSSISSKAGDTIEDFLENYPGVSREQVFAFLEEASRALLAEIA